MRLIWSLVIGGISASLAICLLFALALGHEHIARWMGLGAFVAGIVGLPVPLAYFAMRGAAETDDKPAQAGEG